MRAFVDRHNAPRSKLSLLVVLGSLLLTPASLGAPENSLPAIQSELDWFRLLYAIQDELPAVMNGGTQFGFDPIEVLQAQAKLVKELNELPEYRDAMAKRPDPLGITIRSVGERTVVERRISPADLEHWRNHLVATLKTNPDPAQSAIATIKALQKRSADGMLTGLIAKLPPELKGAAFRQPGFAAKLAFLSGTSLPEAAKTALAEVNSVAALELQLKNLTAVLLAVQAEPGKWEDSAARMARIESLSEEDLHRFLNYTGYVKPRLDALNSLLETKQSHTAVKASVAGAVKEDVDAVFKNAGEVTEKLENQRLHLTELRPGTAVFRGCAGGDCSTKWSFAAPNNPDELVFHLTDEKGHTKGYVEATRVLQKNSAGVEIPSLYVSSINGVRISKSDVDLVLQGFYKEREALGVAQILLPTHDRVDALMNYEGIRLRIKALIAKGAAAMKITHQLPGIRALIEKFDSKYNTAKYDHMSSNTHGVVYRPAESELVGLETETRKLNLASLRLVENLRKPALLGFAVAMEEKFPGFMAKALNAMGIPPEKMASFRGILENSAALPVEEYERSVKAAMVELLQDLTADVSELPADAVFLGRMNAPNAFSPANKEATFGVIANLKQVDHAQFLRGAEKALATNSSAELAKMLSEKMLDIASTATEAKTLAGIAKVFAPVAFSDEFLERGFFRSSHPAFMEFFAEKMANSQEGLAMMDRLLRLSREEFMVRYPERFRNHLRGNRSEYDEFRALILGKLETKGALTYPIVLAAAKAANDEGAAITLARKWYKAKLISEGQFLELFETYARSPNLLPWQVRRLRNAEVKTHCPELYEKIAALPAAS